MSQLHLLNRKIHKTEINWMPTLHSKDIRRTYPIDCWSSFVSLEYGQYVLRVSDDVFMAREFLLKEPQVSVRVVVQPYQLMKSTNSESR